MYCRKYPEWQKLNDAIEEFKNEFSKTERSPKNSKIKRLERDLKSVKKEYRNTMTQNLAILHELSDKKSQLRTFEKKYQDILLNNQKLEFQMGEYIDRYGLLDHS